MNILIVTEPDDIHAALIKCALEYQDIPCFLLFSADMPTKQKNSVIINNEKMHWTSVSLQGEKQCLSTLNFDTIWWRRPRYPSISNSIHPDDENFVKKENISYHQSIPYLLNSNAWWINPPSAQRLAKSKLAQLKLARKCGLPIPNSLISNDPAEIKRFIKNGEKKGVIYKPFNSEYWPDEAHLKAVYTHKIRLKDLPSDQMLQNLPGIYQHYIEKKHELRVTCFGTDIHAVKILSQEHSSGLTDWRKIPLNQLQIEETRLPESVRKKIILYMEKMGLVFGCFDFIVTPNDDFYFLEVNEQGQFLWVEDLIPEVKYLDRFVQFMCSKKFHFQWNQKKNSISTEIFDDEAEKIINYQCQKHVYLNQIQR